MTSPALSINVGANFVTRRCNFSGHETGGPKHLMGGLYGPEYEGTQKWFCTNDAEVRVVMSCHKGHRSSKPMNICRAHAMEIEKRMSDLCIPCAWPPAARGVNEAMNFIQMEITALTQAGVAPAGLLFGSGSIVNADRIVQLQRQLDQHREQMDELYRSGVIQKNPLKLEEIS
jgi:hypothetical protein